MSSPHASTLPPLPLPAEIRQRYIDLTDEPTCGLTFFVLEAGDPTHPLVLLLHGFPELAYTWRRVLAPLAARGLHVVAPDLRGYGRTTGWREEDASSRGSSSSSSSYAQTTDLAQFGMPQIVLDCLALLRAGLGHESAACVVGHDFGAAAASACALARPDLFRAAVFASHAPGGAPALPPLRAGGSSSGTDSSSVGGGVKSSGPELFPRDPDVHASLARWRGSSGPRKHYQRYNSTAAAAADYENPPQGLAAFLRGYVHLKSHVWRGNYDGFEGMETGRGVEGDGAAARLTGWTAEQLARMPGYYIMPLGATMPEVVARGMEGEDWGRTRAFLPDEELAVYVAEFGRTGFQGMLNWYRAAAAAATEGAGASPGSSGTPNGHMALFAGRRFEVPVLYVGGEADWGNYQRPGALEGLESGRTAVDYRGTRIHAGAGHWPQTEIPQVLCDDIVSLLVDIGFEEKSGSSMSPSGG